MSDPIYIVIVLALVALLVGWTIRRQRSLKLRAHLMEEAMRNRDFTFRLPTNGLLPGERAMQQTLNQMSETIRRQVSQSEVEAWERLTRVLTHEMMNATAPITSLSQSMLNRNDVKGTSLEPAIQAIYDTSRHLSDFVANYRKMTELEKAVVADVALPSLLDDVRRAYPDLLWEVSVPAPAKDSNVQLAAGTVVSADAGLLRQVLMNLVKNAVEAKATRILVKQVEESTNGQLLTLYVGNDGLPIPAENRQSLFVPFFTTKRSGSGIGLSLSRRMMVQQGGMLDLAEKQHGGCRVGFLLTLLRPSKSHPLL